MCPQEYCNDEQIIKTPELCDQVVVVSDRSALAGTLFELILGGSQCRGGKRCIDMHDLYVVPVFI